MQVGGQVGGQVGDVLLSEDKLNQLLDYCLEPRSSAELRTHLGISSRSYVREKIIEPCLKLGLLKMTIPDKPNSSKQKYVRK